MTKALSILAVLACSACATHRLDTDDPCCAVDAGAPAVDAGPLPTFWACTCTLDSAVAPTAAAVDTLRAPCAVDDPVAWFGSMVCQGAVPCACKCKPMDYPVLDDAGTLDPRCE